jgi:multisubunit Na+/H+ antiporter MnhB subunit
MRGSVTPIVAGGVVAAFAGAYFVALGALSDATPRGLSAEVLRRLDESGVTNPVTAVILSFRGYDTLVEIGVITVAGLAVTALLPAAQEGAVPSPPADPVMAGLLRGLWPVAVLFGVYLLWKGAKEPGGAFQGAAVLAGAAILGHLAGHGVRRADRRGLLVASSGIAVFTLAAAALAIGPGVTLQHHPRFAGWSILVIETACFVSLALVLTWMVTGFDTGAARSRGGEGGQS